MKISVVICHHKGNLILDAVKSVLLSRNVELEIVIATSDPKFHYQHEKVIYFCADTGPAEKRNLAVRFCQYPLVAFFDDDVKVKPWAIYHMAKAMEDENIGMVFGKLLNMEFPTRFDEAGSYLTWSGFLWARAESGCEDRRQFDLSEPILAGKSAACMIRRKLFNECGGFDKDYEILAEETDLAWRVWLSGKSVMYIPSSITLHAFNTKFKPPDMYTPKRVYFNGCRNYISMLMTNLGNENLIIPVIVQFVVWISAGVGFVMTGKVEAGFNVFRGIFWVIIHFKKILSKRKIVQKKRKVSDKFLLPIIRRNPSIKYYICRFFHYIKTGRHG